MAEQWQFRVNDGAWQNVQDGVSYSHPVTAHEHTVRITHRIKPPYIDSEIVHALRLYVDSIGPSPTGASPGFDSLLSQVRKYLNGDF